MADETQDFDTVTIPELDNLTIALNSYFATSNLNGKLGKATVQELVTFMAPFIQGVAASGFVNTPGTVLPTATSGKFTFVGPGTFTQTTGGSITTTQFLNLLVANGTSWALVLPIPIAIPTAKIQAWTAQTYTSGSQVVRNGYIYESAAATTAAQEPGLVAETIWKRLTFPWSALAARFYKTGDFTSNINNEISMAIKDTQITDTSNTTGQLMKIGFNPSNVYNIENYYGR